MVMNHGGLREHVGVAEEKQYVSLRSLYVTRGMIVMDLGLNDLDPDP